MPRPRLQSQSQTPTASPAKTAGIKRQRAISIGAADKRLKNQTGAATKKQSLLQQSQSADDAHINQASDATSTMSSSSTGVDALHQEIVALRDVVQRHEQTIVVLEQRINDLLSAFGLPTTAVSEQSSTTVANGHTAATSTSTSTSSYSTAVASKPTPRTIRETIVAAVYIDKAASDRRTSSFIVSGMPPSSSCDDKTMVTELCHHEIGVLPEVTATKRLGKPTTGKVQPMLVHVKNVDDARKITTEAKKLRQSADSFVKQNVYINTNLTRAEAKAAYELRCRRREAAARGHANAAMNIDPSSNGAPADLGPASLTSSIHVNATTTLLSAAAPTVLTMPHYTIATPPTNVNTTVSASQPTN